MVEKLKRKIHFKFKRKSLFMYKNITILAFEIQRFWLLESLPIKVVEVAIVVPAMQLTISQPTFHLRENVVINTIERSTKASISSAINTLYGQF